MDTHMTAGPDLDSIGTPLGSPIGLPGELGGSNEASGSDSAPAASPLQPAQRKRSRRKGLLATAAFGAVFLTAAGGAGWKYRHDLMALDLRHLELPAFLHRGTGPAAQPPAEVGIQPGAAPVAQARRPEAAPASAALRPQASEFASLQSLSGSQPAEIGVSAPAPSPILGSRDSVPSSPTSTEDPPAPPHAPAAQPVPSVDPVAGATTATDAAPIPSPAAEKSAGLSPTSPGATPAAAPDTAQQAPVTPSLNTPAPAANIAPPVRDPVAVAAELRAAPLSSPEQIKVVDLVKELGAQLRDTRTEVAQLRTTVAQLVETVETRTTQFESRLSLAEAGTVLAQSARAGRPETPAPTPSSPPAFRVASTGRVLPQTVSVADSSVSSPPRTVKDYKLQGASPGLAVLSVLNPAPGGQSVLEITTGSEVPGLGRIKSIFQRGTAWVVQTDAGVIQ